jgi:hypothetical protein
MCIICKLPCHRLLYDTYQEQALSSLKGKDQESLFFYQDGSFSDQGKLVFKSKTASTSHIADELAIDVVDSNVLDDQGNPGQLDLYHLHGVTPQTSFNHEDYMFFKKLLNDDASKDMIQDLCNKLSVSLRLEEHVPIPAINEIDL